MPAKRQDLFSFPAPTTLDFLNVHWTKSSLNYVLRTYSSTICIYLHTGTNPSGVWLVGVTPAPQGTLKLGPDWLGRTL